MHTATFHPLGNADSCLIELEKGKKLLFDYANMRDPDDDADKDILLPHNCARHALTGNFAGITWLEMEYYRRVANENSMSGHLLGDGGQVRYARSCGDITSKINQSLVALHAAIGSHNLRESLGQDGASIAVYRADAGNLEVRKLTFEPDLFSRERESGWTVCVSEGVLTKVHRMRSERLPNETGGVLVGNFDRQRNVIYVVDALGSPKDSTEWPTLYVRGVRGLRAELERIEKATLSNLEYVGEWHSHPPRCAAAPSRTDQRALATLAEEMTRTGSPAVMLIVAERNRQGFFLR